MAASKGKTAPGSKAGRTAPRFGSPEWRKQHGLPVSTKTKAPAKKKAAAASKAKAGRK